jgi:hypothetical protein
MQRTVAPINAAPLERDLELAVLDRGDVYALVFPSRRTLGGWSTRRIGASGKGLSQALEPVARTASDVGSCRSCSAHQKEPPPIYIAGAVYGDALVAAGMDRGKPASNSAASNATQSA